MSRIKNGYTLIELLITLAIICIVALVVTAIIAVIALAIWALKTQRTKAQFNHPSAVISIFVAQQHLIKHPALRT